MKQSVVIGSENRDTSRIAERPKILENYENIRKIPRFHRIIAPQIKILSQLAKNK